MTDDQGGSYHEPVLADEVVGMLRSAKTVLDGTLGGGGHTTALLREGVQKVIGVDRDPDALATARARLLPFEREGRFRAVLANYADVADAQEIAGERIEGILLDLGVSSHQLDLAERGFTFREGAPLDMRMGSEGADAADLLNRADERELAAIFRDFGDEPRAVRLAREIVRRRAAPRHAAMDETADGGRGTARPFATSDDLVRAIRGALGPRSGPADFARIFQAVRIAVNDELEGLKRALPALRDRLAAGGIMAIITYHSGEDRIVKHAFRDWSADCVCPPRQPACTCRGHSLGDTLTRRAILPSEPELAANPRARSAKLRAWRKHEEPRGQET